MILEKSLFRVVLPDDLKYIISEYVTGDIDYFNNDQFLDAVASNIQCKDNNIILEAIK